MDEDPVRAARRFTADLMPWEGSNHETVVVARSGPRRGGLRLLCLKDTRLKFSLHPDLLNFLANHGVVTTGGSGSSSLGGGGGGGGKSTAAEAAAEAENSTLHGLLGEVTDRHLSSKRALRLLGGRYVLTPDTLLKMTAIVNRMRCGVPVILMGECGCGKTMLLRYLCAW